ncbi:MAG: deoxyribonuclease IV [Candidatus Babeliales bacterium]
MRTIGLHLRIFSDLVATAHQALALQLPTFQCFLMYQETKRPLRPSQKNIQQFLVLRQQFKELFVHGSYWINLCGVNAEKSLHVLKKELDVAKRCGFSHYILHPGSSNGLYEREKGIECLISTLNNLTDHEQDITIVLENTAHGGMSVGGDFADFVYILERLDYPERIKFCLDTAHAYAFGYDIVTAREDFFKRIEQTIGFSSLAVIHLNDTQESLGLKRDRHEAPGQGNIGIEALQAIAMDERLKHIPLILETPQCSLEEQKSIIALIHGWHENKEKE